MLSNYYIDLKAIIEVAICFLFLSDEPLKLECIHVKPEEGHAVMHYATPTHMPKKSRRLLTSNDSAKPFDSDSDQSDDETMSGGKTVYSDYTPQLLTDFMRTEPSKYVIIIKAAWFLKS